MASLRDRVWSFEVSDTAKHSKGYTIYKVEFKVFYIRAPEKITKGVIWKRYNDFKLLYKVMFSLHKALHRPDGFPEFAKPKFFGRFDESVIEERKVSAVKLLNFISCQTHLYKSQVFQKFLEKGEDYASEDNYPNSIIQKNRPPKMLSKDTSSFDSDSEVSLDLPTPDTSKSGPVFPTKRNSLVELKSSISCETKYNQSSREDGHQSPSEHFDDVWNQPHISDTISLNSVDDEDDIDGDVESAVGTQLPDADISFFDPLMSVNEKEPSSLGSDSHQSNRWLLAALSTCVVMDEQDSMDAKAATDGFFHQRGYSEVSCGNSSRTSSISTFSDILGDRQLLQNDNSVKLLEDYDRSFDLDLSEFDPLRERVQSTVECGKGDLDLSLSLPHSSASSACSTPMHSCGLKLTNFSPNPRQQLSQSSSHSSEMAMIVGGKEDYIYVAANQICQAQECEASGKFEMAFAFYRNGVEILLQGVQGDGNKTRREAVRRKTAQYLMKAEDLYNRHLANESNDERRWAVDSTISPPLEVDPSLAFLRGPLSELKNYKVLGTIDQVLLVLDRSCDETYVMKVIHKSGAETRNVRNILPTCCPFMVQLYKFYEGKDMIYLVLQHASGGKLWTYISGYLQLNTTPTREVHVADLWEISGSNGNVYRGCKLHSTDNKLTNANMSNSKDFLNVTLEAACDKDELGKCVMSYVELFTKESEERVAQFSSNYSGTCVQSEKLEEKLEGHELRYSSLSLDGNVEESSDSHLKAELPDSPQDGDGQFQELLQKSKPLLENFSIDSFDSGDGVQQRLSSGFSDQIESIPEAVETGPLSDQNLLHLDDVFTTSPSASNCRNIEAYQQDDIFAVGDILRNSKDLIKNVTEVLDSSERSSSKHSTSKKINFQNKSSSLFQNKPTDGEPEEVSIYDLDKYENITDVNDTFVCDNTCDVNSLPESSKVTSQSCNSEETKVNFSGDNSQSHSTQFNRDDILPQSSQPTENTFTASQMDQLKGVNICDNSGASILSKKNFQESQIICHRHPFKDFTRSASFEYDLKSPSKNRLRTTSALFEEMDTMLMRPVNLPESCIKQWTAEIITALSYLHAQGIICRDLKPANILLGDQGHVLLTHFSQLNNVDSVLDDSAIDHLYAAPEVRSIGCYTEVCDWWSVGTLLYELLAGKSLASCHPGGITSHTQLLIPSHITPEAQGLLEELLCYNPRERLGSGINGAEEIKAHPFFSDIDWNLLENTSIVL